MSDELKRDLPRLPNLAQRIAWARKNLTTLNQELAGEAIGVSGAAISNWENGKDEPTRENLRKAATIYNVPFAWLASDEHIPSEDIARTLSRDDDDDEDDGFSSATPYRSKVEGAFPGVDARAGAGQGQVGEMRLIKLAHGNTAVGHRVIDEWLFPSDYIRHELKAAPSRIIMLEVVGDSMSPTLQSGDRVVVDYSHNRPVPDGLYVIDEGEGPLVKRLQIVRRSEPATIEIISDNPNHKPYTLPLDTVVIIGRVAARIARM